MGVIFSGEDGMRHCTECDSPELSPGEINPYGVCFGCADGDPDAGKPEPPSAAAENAVLQALVRTESADDE